MKRISEEFGLNVHSGKQEYAASHVGDAQATYDRREPGRGLIGEAEVIEMVGSPPPVARWPVEYPPILRAVRIALTLTLNQ